MTDQISIEIMMDPPDSMRRGVKNQSIDPPVDSPTATLSCFSDYDMHEEGDENLEDDDRLMSHFPELDDENASFEFDKPTMIRMRQEMQNWKRERQELLKLRKIVTKQQQLQEELETKLAVYLRQQGHKQGGPKDPNGHHVQSLTIDEMLRRNFNCFPVDEIAMQLEEVQSMLEANKQQVHELQVELREARNDKESAEIDHFKIRESLQKQLQAAEDQLDAERRKRDDAMSVHKLQMELLHMRAKEDEEEWDSQVQFWKDQFEQAQNQLQGEVVAFNAKQGEQQGVEHGENDNIGEGDEPKQDEDHSQSLETVPEEQHGQAQMDSVQLEVNNEGEEGVVLKPDDERKRGSDNDSNEAIDASEELAEYKSRYEESGVRLTKLEAVIYEMVISQHTMVQKIQSVVQLLQKTQDENEKLKKSKAALLQKNKTESEKLKKEKLNLEIQGVVRLLQKNKQENDKLKKEKAVLLQKIKRESEKRKKQRLNLEIQGVARLLQKTKDENEMLKKETQTWRQRSKRETDKLKMEKLTLEKQRKEKLTVMTLNAHR